MNNEPSYFGLTNDHTWLSVDAEYYKKLKSRTIVNSWQFVGNDTRNYLQ